MKKKIIISFFLLFLLFFSGIAITLFIVKQTTENLNSLLALHKVEIIRQDLVINVQTVQSHLYTAGTLFGQDLDIIVDNVLMLRDKVQGCSYCHHEPPIADGLLELEDLTDQYREALSYFITSTADAKRIERLQAVAAGIGDTIIAKSQRMAFIANESLRRKTKVSLEKVAGSKKVLAATLAFALLVVIAITIYLVKSITTPVHELLRATRKIRQGELGYVSSYEYKAADEFGELIKSFNEMSLILSRNNEKILAHMARNQTILQTTTDGFMLVDEEGILVDANPAFCKMAGYTREELMGMNFADFFGFGLDSTILLARIKKARSMLFQIDQKTRAGGRVPVEISTSFTEMNGRGNYFCFVRDISERKKMEDELLRGQKLESLGVLAGGIAHDFNNLLTGITGYIDLTLRSLIVGQKNYGWLESAKKASVRAQNLTQQLLTFSRGGEPVKTVVSIKDILEESIRFALSGSRVKCEYRLPEDLWHINADKGQIGQVVQNIILNGAQAMPEGGMITVSSENVVVSEADALPLADGEYVKTAFTDQGSGIAQRDLARVFDPYFSTKQTGSGLGLTICHSIVDKHRGYIGVESELGAGTTFTMYLPASRGQQQISEAQAGREMPGRGRVLVMDDEEDVRGIVGEMLHYLGYEPDFAEDGEQAIELYCKAMHDGVPYEAVIMDLTIPGGMGGGEAIVRLLEKDPDIKAIVSSGYSNDPVMAEHEAHGFKGVVTKPFDTEQLSRVLHDIIKS